MRLRQLSDLIADVRSLTDTQNATAFVTDAEVTEWINQAWTRVYGALCASGESYYLSSATFTATAGQPSYYTTSASGVPTGTAVLPTDLWTLKGVDIQPSGGYWVNAHRFEFEKRNDYQANVTTWNWPSRPLYDYQGSGATASIRFLPTPTDSVSSARAWYFPAATRLVNSTDTIDGGNGWERWAIAIAARWVALKDENYELVAQLAQDIAQWEMAAKAEIASRNIEEAPQMRRVRYRRMRGRFPYGPGDGGW